MTTTEAWLGINPAKCLKDSDTPHNIDVHEMTLGKWVKNERDARESSRPTDAPLSESERAELIRLRQENKNVKAENAQLQMQVSFAKKWRPGSRTTSSEVRCDRGLG
ncbi:hypothetical protein GCM10009811_31350 [Nostocoides veronense]|uniref:Transposase n=1 Tax=Nostocoides veronense TaxID=330836 RepID=A0ABP4Y6T5_9MICO